MGERISGGSKNTYLDIVIRLLSDRCCSQLSQFLLVKEQHLNVEKNHGVSNVQQILLERRKEVKVGTSLWRKLKVDPP